MRSTRSSSNNLSVTVQAPLPRSNRQVRVFAFAASFCSAAKFGIGERPKWHAYVLAIAADRGIGALIVFLRRR